MKLISKSFTLGDLITVSYTLSTTKIKSIDFIDEFNKIKIKTDNL